MKQVLQNLQNGQVSVVEVPVPQLGRGEVLIRTCKSLLSPGTERMLVEFGRGGWISKAFQQPEKVQQVLEKIQTDGLAATLDAVKSKLDKPMPLGYSNVGKVIVVGDEVHGISPGDRVVSNGPHAEVVAVPKNLCVRIPNNVADDVAAFTVIGAIGLQGIRLAEPTLGESFVVIGLGIVGLMTVQLLCSHGCRVLGIDLDDSRLVLARQLGAETANPAKGDDVLVAAEHFSRGNGVDGVLLTLASESSEPVSQAARMCRKRGRIVLVGVTGLELNRTDFYEKELSFQVSCSYGPGRYDPDYEVKGQDYPVGFVRWTEQRNFKAVLDIMSSGRLDPKLLISHSFPIERAAEAYDLLVSEADSLGILLEYAQESSDEPLGHSISLTGDRHVDRVERRPRVSFIGAGDYAGRILIPAFQESGASLSTVVTSSGVCGVHYGKKYGFEKAGTQPEEVFGEDCDVVVIATRHNTHADLVVGALNGNKHVFVEKPLALSLEELSTIRGAMDGAPGRMVMIGFNRRFAPHVMKMKSLLKGMQAPKAIIITVNAGEIPADHWIQNREVGGGRIVGEACHFIDLLRYLAGNSITGWDVSSMSRVEGLTGGDDKAVITLRFADGSFGTLNYLANGHKSFPKERIEVFCAGRVLQLDNFRKLRGWGWPNFRKMSLWRQDKGQHACVAAFMNAVQSGSLPPIPTSEILEISQTSIEIAAAASGK